MSNIRSNLAREREALRIKRNYQKEAEIAQKNADFFTLRFSISKLDDIEKFQTKLDREILNIHNKYKLINKKEDDNQIEQTLKSFEDELSSLKCSISQIINKINHPLSSSLSSCPCLQQIKIEALELKQKISMFNGYRYNSDEIMLLFRKLENGIEDIEEF